MRRGIVVLHQIELGIWDGLHLTIFIGKVHFEAKMKEVIRL